KEPPAVYPSVIPRLAHHAPALAMRQRTGRTEGRRGCTRLLTLAGAHGHPTPGKVAYLAELADLGMADPLRPSPATLCPPLQVCQLTWQTWHTCDRPGAANTTGWITQAGAGLPKLLPDRGQLAQASAAGSVPQHLPVRFLVEADQQRLTQAQARRF